MFSVIERCERTGDGVLTSTPCGRLPWGTAGLSVSSPRIVIPILVQHNSLTQAWRKFMCTRPPNLFPCLIKWNLFPVQSNRCRLPQSFLPRPFKARGQVSVDQWPVIGLILLSNSEVNSELRFPRGQTSQNGGNGQPFEQTFIMPQIQVSSRLTVSWGIHSFPSPPSLL